MAIKSKARHDLTLRSIKREIAAGRDVAFWLDKAYTHYDNGLLTEDDIAEWKHWHKRIMMLWTLKRCRTATQRMNRFKIRCTRRKINETLKR